MIPKLTYRILLGLIVGLFILPIVQRNTHLFSFRTLKGEYYAHQKPKITLQSWLEGSYQRKMDQYCTDSFGFRNSLVRSVNQVDYWAFNEANAQYVVIGKNNCLYETPYIEAHLGMDFLGDFSITDKVLKLSRIKDTLASMGIALDIILAPGKASYHPEYIPDYYFQYQKPQTNYTAFKQHLSKKGIAYLDLHQWFREKKPHTEHPLFPLTGIHWSKFGMVLATDSILNYWNTQYPDSLPNLDWSLPKETTTITLGSDADVEDGLNIFSTLPHFEMIYPLYDLKNEGRYKPKTAVIADSYYWGLFDIGLSTIACDSGEFWYYFRQVYPQSFEENMMIDDLDIQNAIETKDRIVILQTDATLGRFGFGFIEKVYDIYFPKT